MLRDRGLGDTKASFDVDDDCPCGLFAYGQEFQNPTGLDPKNIESARSFVPTD